jgi:hypothetical protein
MRQHEFLIDIQAARAKGGTTLREPQKAMPDKRQAGNNHN